MKVVTVYTDGSADNDKKIGSYGIILTAKVKGIPHLKRHSSRKYVDTTNNRMELKAIIKALQLISHGYYIDIYSDSEYCVKGANEWLSGWVRNRKLDEKQNADLWKKFIEERDRHLNAGSKIKIVWVRGHAGNELNEMADKAACIGRYSQEAGISCKANN